VRGKEDLLRDMYAGESVVITTDLIGKFAALSEVIWPVDPSKELCDGL
jgi:hypothetical protein